MGLFALGDINPLLVDRFGGFDLPRFAAPVMLIGDGGPGPHQVLQSSGTPMRTASISGHLAEPGDVDLLRGYDQSKEEITFVDGNGNETTVAVLELSIDDETAWQNFSATLIATT